MIIFHLRHGLFRRGDEILVRRGAIGRRLIVRIRNRRMVLVMRRGRRGRLSGSGWGIIGIILIIHGGVSPVVVVIGIAIGLVLVG